MTYYAKMARAQWRALYIKIELAQPEHKAALRWLTAAAGELVDLADVVHKPGGMIVGDAFEKAAGEELISRALTRDAVLGIKYALVQLLQQKGPRAVNMMERQDLLDAVGGIGESGKIRRLVELSAPLPDVEADESLEEVILKNAKTEELPRDA